MSDLLYDSKEHQMRKLESKIVSNLLKFGPSEIIKCSATKWGCFITWSLSHQVHYASLCCNTIECLGSNSRALCRSRFRSPHLRMCSKASTFSATRLESGAFMPLASEHYLTFASATLNRFNRLKQWFWNSILSSSRHCCLRTLWNTFGPCELKLMCLSQKIAIISLLPSQEAVVEACPACSSPSCAPASPLRVSFFFLPSYFIYMPDGYLQGRWAETKMEGWAHQELEKLVTERGIFARSNYVWLLKPNEWIGSFDESRRFFAFVSASWVWPSFYHQTIYYSKYTHLC